MVDVAPIYYIDSKREQFRGPRGQRVVFHRHKMGDKFVYELTRFTPPAPLTIYADDAKRSSLSVFEWESHEDSALFIVDFEQIQDKEEVDRFLSPSDSSDVALVVGGDKIYAKKETLAMHSNYFKALFYGDFAEKNQAEVAIGDDVTSEEMLALVMLLSKSRNYMISNGNCEDMIRLADRFDAAWLAQDCYFFAAFHSELSFQRRMKMLAKSRDERLIDRFLDSLNPSQHFALANSEFLKSVDNDIQNKVLRLGLDSLKNTVQKCWCSNTSSCCRVVKKAYDMISDC